MFLIGLAIPAANANLFDHITVSARDVTYPEADINDNSLSPVRLGDDLVQTDLHRRLQAQPRCLCGMAGLCCDETLRFFDMGQQQNITTVNNVARSSIFGTAAGDLFGVVYVPVDTTTMTVTACSNPSSGAVPAVRCGLSHFI
jgi:hypothetical protein